MPKRTAIVLLNWNGLDDTVECLNSLRELLCQDYTPIVVDNASDENLAPIEAIPNVVLIRNPDNFGFSKGNNIGIRAAAELGCEYCWILNNDTLVHPESLSRLVDFMDRNPGIGAVTNRIN